MKKQKIIVTAFIYNNEGKLLAAQRSAKKKFLPNVWELVGGHVDFGEQCEEALKREIKEELDIDIVIERPYHIFTYVGNAETHAVEIVYFAKMKKPDQEIRPALEEIQNVKWISAGEIDDYYDNSLPEYPAVKKGFKLLQKKL